MRLLGKCRGCGVKQPKVLVEIECPGCGLKRKVLMKVDALGEYNG